MYEPREDSFLLLESVKKYAKGNILDMGTGSGILAFEASKLNNVNLVVGIDIDNNAIEYCKKKYKTIKNLYFLKSDLFKIFNKNNKKILKIKKINFDIIIFNPPYLPKEFMYPKFDDKAIFGGRKGYELIGRFLKDVKPYLNKKGYILLLFSSLTHKNKVDDLIKKNNFSCQQIDYLKLDFEELYVYLIK